MAKTNAEEVEFAKDIANIWKGKYNDADPSLEIDRRYLIDQDGALVGDVHSIISGGREVRFSREVKGLDSVVRSLKVIDGKKETMIAVKGGTSDSGETALLTKFTEYANRYDERAIMAKGAEKLKGRGR